MSIRKQLADLYGEDLLFLDPPEVFDEYIIGVAERFHDRFVVYSRSGIIEKLTADAVADGQDATEAEQDSIEHYEFNIVGGWVGDTTPAFLLTDED